MFKSLTQAPIKIRLPVLIFVAMFTGISLISYADYIGFKASTEENAQTFSRTIAQNAKTRVLSLVERFHKEVDALAADHSTKDAIIAFSAATTTNTQSNLAELRKTYITDNPFPVGERDEFLGDGSSNPYDVIHAEYHDQFRRIARRSEYYDLFFILPDGSVAYSVFKADDFGTNLNDGPYADSGLAHVYKAALNAEQTEGVFNDYEFYAPSAGAPAAFMAQQVRSDSGELLGVVAIQLSTMAIDVALSQSTNLREADEIYIVSSDGRVRSDSRGAGLLSILAPVPNLPQAQIKSAGENLHFENVMGIRGAAVVAHTRGMQFLGSEWAVVVELDRDTVFAPLYKFQRLVLISLAIGGALSLIIGFLLARSITRPINAFADSMMAISNENYDIEVAGLARSDEIGQLSRALGVFREKLAASHDTDLLMRKEREEQERIVDNLGQGLKGLADGNLTVQIHTPFSVEYEGLRTDFNTTVETMNDLMQSVVNNADEIRTRADEISASSDNLSERTENQAATLEETAAALEELTASVRSAAESASEVEGVVTDARQDAEKSGTVVDEAVEAMSLIRKSSTEISQIIGVIDDIAFQTNLLSLNAGVEAARAGTAGRGFAVVASEVRALAQRSSEAAKQIKSLINSSTEQVETGVGLVARTGDALGAIVERVSNIDALVAGIASGAREQSVGLGEINVGMSHLDQVTQQNAAMVEEATATAMTLKNESAALSQLVARFKLQEVGAQKEDVSTSEVIEFRRAQPKAVNEIPVKVVNAPKSQFSATADGSLWQDF